MGIEPVTRKEMFMAAAAGESVTALTPVTREEYFLSKIAGSGGGSGGGADDVYLIKRIINYDTQNIELQGDYAGAMEAWQSGKKLKFVEGASYGGQEIIRYESFSYAKVSSGFTFVCYGGRNFVDYTLTESGITGGDESTYLKSLYVENPVGFYLKSPSKKWFRVKVSDTGELSTEEIT